MTGALDSFLDRAAPDVRARHGVPTTEELERRSRGLEIVRRVIADRLRPDGLRVSPLGAGWSRDVDAYVTSWPSESALRSAGWLRLDELYARLGVPGRGRWAVVEGSELLVAVDLHEGQPPDPVAAVLARCRRRREVRLREALELSALLAGGHALDRREPAIAAAAAIECFWGGNVLSAFTAGPPSEGPVPLPARPLRRVVKAVVSPLRPRVTLAISGVDGAGKSTVGAAFRELLARLGVPVRAVWARPGLRLGAITKVSRPLKHLLGQRAGPGVAIAAQGRGSELPSRRGLIGWLWSFVVTVAFLLDVYRQHLRAPGVVVYDRHVVDAVATLDALYAGPNLSVQRALVRRLLPRASLTVYLKVDAEVAASRKPGDMIGARAVAAQLKSYGDEIEGISPLLELDGTSSVKENSLAILRHLLACVASRGPGRATD